MNANATTTSWLALFTSFGTLICCALPLLLVTLGFGATVAALTSGIPWLIPLSEHKEWIFLGSGVLLLVAAWRVHSPGQSCPPQPELQRVCLRTRAWNGRILWASIATWTIGFFAAYLALPVLLWLERY